LFKDCRADYPGDEEIRVDMIKVFKILRGFVGTDEVNRFQRKLENTKGHDLQFDYIK